MLPSSILTRRVEIYRIVSSKALEPGESTLNQPGQGRTIDFTPQENDQKQGCC